MLQWLTSPGIIYTVLICVIRIAFVRATFICHVTRLYKHTVHLHNCLCIVFGLCTFNSVIARCSLVSLEIMILISRFSRLRVSKSILKFMQKS